MRCFNSPWLHIAWHCRYGLHSVAPGFDELEPLKSQLQRFDVSWGKCLVFYTPSNCSNIHASTDLTSLVMHIVPAGLLHLSGAGPPGNQASQSHHLCAHPGAGAGCAGLSLQVQRGKFELGQL